TTLYVNKFFEVREHDAPTKYIWNGNTRVARVTGSLNTNQRVQRLRLYPGWNLVSLAVTTSASDLQSQIPDLQSLHWNSTSQTWTPVGTVEMLVAGTVLWLKSTTNATLAVTGPYAEPTSRTVTATGDFLPSAGLEVWDIKSAISNVPFATAWTFDGSSARWLSWLPPPLELQSDLPAFLAPGQAVFARADAPAQLEVPESALRIRYYHEDHLGSTSSVTDSVGQLAEECALYPFGEPRVVFQPRALTEAYLFTQKERDAEAAFSYFEARYLANSLARFASVDHMAIEMPTDVLGMPQATHCYAYAGNRPTTHNDDSGHFLHAVVGALIGAAVEVAAQVGEKLAETSIKEGRMPTWGEVGKAFTSVNRVDVGIAALQGGLTGGGSAFKSIGKFAAGFAWRQAKSALKDVVLKSGVTSADRLLEYSGASKETRANVKLGLDLGRSAPGLKKGIHDLRETKNEIRGVRKWMKDTPFTKSQLKSLELNEARQTIDVWTKSVKALEKVSDRMLEH
ncbi:MAG: hypothetical protein NT154_18635, partial [Verrucomicrobia bacterium]|nr:hypothetical protein [Verrucomicrobiota bacterium]